MATLVNEITAVDPPALAQWCRDQDPPIPTDRWWGKANSFTLEPGREPGRGSVLLRKVDCDKLNPAASVTLTFSGSDADHVLKLKEITVLSAECIIPGAPTDPNTIYLVEVADRRHHLARIPLTGGYKAYNVSNASGARTSPQRSTADRRGLGKKS